MEEVKNSIKTILPSLTNELLESTMKVLEDLGVDDFQHLELVEVEDLTPVLKKIQARLLIKEWRKNKQDVVESTLNAIASTSLPTPVVSTNNCMPAASSAKTDNTQSFNPQKYRVDWESMPDDLQRCLIENQRPKPKLRLEMVRLIADHIYKYNKKPGKRVLSIVAENIVSQYPKSFADEIGVKLNGTSHLSLTTQLEVRFNNMNRSSVEHVLKRKSKNEGENSAKKVKSSDSYGCVNYQPDLPLTESTQSQAEKCQEMKLAHEKKVEINEEIQNLLKATYYSIRKDINSGKPLNFLTTEWPFLFTKAGMLNHFHELVGVNCEEKLSSSISKIGITIISFFMNHPKVQPTNKEKFNSLIAEVKKNSGQKEDMYTWPVLLCLLMTYFGDEIEVLFIIVEVASSIGELEMVVPSTPCLICCGEDINNLSTFMLSIDSKIVMQDIASFEDGLALMFASFFCLNIEYPYSAATTLEFIQRCFLDINPLKGSKADSSKKSKGINPKIVSLKKKITDFEWNL